MKKKNVDEMFYKMFCIYKNGKVYQKHKERLRKEARERHQNLSDENKGRRQISKTFLKVKAKAT